MSACQRIRGKDMTCEAGLSNSSHGSRSTHGKYEVISFAVLRSGTGLHLLGLLKFCNRTSSRCAAGSFWVQWAFVAQRQKTMLIPHLRVKTRGYSQLVPQKRDKPLRAAPILSPLQSFYDLFLISSFAN